MKFLHVADAHLDSPFGGLSFLPNTIHQQIQDSTNHAFSKMVDFAIEKRVDFVLLVGDTFDTNSPAPATQLFLMQQIERLTEEKIHVYLSFGNHDYMVPENLLIKASEFVHIFGSEVETKTLTTNDNVTVDIVGFSYIQNHIMTDLAATYPAKNSAHYTIGTLHGSEAAGASDANNYAPFGLTALKELNYDYFALGHIHLRQILSEQPYVIYPGNLQGRHVNEPGDKGFYLVEVASDSFKTTIEFVPTSIYVWQKNSVQVAKNLTKDELLSSIVEQLRDALAQDSTGKLITLNIDNSENLSTEHRELLTDKSILTFINQQLPEQDYVVRLRFNLSKSLELNSLDQHYFELAKDETFSSTNIEETAKSLMKYDFLTDFLNDEETVKLVQEQAELLIQQEIKGKQNAD